MKSNKLIFGNKTYEMNKWMSNTKKVIEKISYDKTNFNIITHQRALIPDVFVDVKEEVKNIKVEIRFLFKTNKKNTIDEIIYKFINEIKYQKYNELTIGDYWCRAVLSNADFEVFNNTALLELDFINFDGKFYGSIETVNATTMLTINNETDYGILEITPSAKDVTITENITGKKLLLKSMIIERIATINLKEKTVKQAGVDSQLDISSKFFILYPNTKLVINGATGNLKYREVII